MTSILNVGDAVLYTKSYGARPQAGNVHRVTKTQARATLTGGSEVGPFQREAWNGEHELTSRTMSRWNGYATIRLKTDEAEARLNEAAEQAEKAAAEKAASQQARQEAYAERLAAELAAAKEAWAASRCPGQPQQPTDRVDTMPDGSRIYTLDIPVHPGYAERKKGWERLIVRCWNAEDWDWKGSRQAGECVKIQVVESAHTYTNGSSSSFASCSTSKHANDEAAVWEAIRSQYHSW